MKKIIKQQPQAIQRPVAKMAPKQTLPPIEEDDEEGDDIEMEEEPAPTAKIKGRMPIARTVEEEEEVEEEPTRKPLLAPKKKGNLSALAKAFASVPTGDQNIRPGIHEAILQSIILQQPDAAGKQSVRLNADLCSSEFEHQNKIADWRMLVKDGQPVMGGIRQLQLDLARLGYELPEADEDFDENLVATFDAINKEKPGVLINVKYQNANGVDYMHFNIHQLADENNEVIAEYRETKPY